jgi:aerobic-type carbon monoxide dehydrogenase small subunit (CoxS/CutS family)
MSAYALLLAIPRPSEAAIIEHMDNNLCRCGSHVRVVQAIRAAAASMKGAGQ